MLEQITDFAKQLFALTRDMQQTKEEIKALREEIKALRETGHEKDLQFVEMTRFAERVVMELQRTREAAESDKRLLRLEMENLLLRHSRGLPASQPIPGADPEDSSA